MLLGSMDPIKLRDYCLPETHSEVPDGAPAQYISVNSAVTTTNTSAQITTISWNGK